MKTLLVPGVPGLEGEFRAERKKIGRIPSKALLTRAADQPDDIATDQTCVQCRGEIDGKEHLVAVSGKAFWLHPECVRFWLAALDEGHSPEGAPADPAASSRPAPSPSRGAAFRVKGPAPPGSVCVFCYRDEGEAVLRIASTEAGSKSETLHKKCAAHWFAVLDGDE